MCQVSPCPVLQYAVYAVEKMSCFVPSSSLASSTPIRPLPDGQVVDFPLAHSAVSASMTSTSCGTWYQHVCFYLDQYWDQSKGVQNTVVLSEERGSYASHNPHHG